MTKTTPTRALCPAQGEKPARYVPSYATNLRATFARIRKQQRQQAREIAA
jgi:hypothetical protein